MAIGTSVGNNNLAVQLECHCADYCSAVCWINRDVYAG